MTKDELLNFLKENLEIQANIKNIYDGKILIVTILIDGHIVSESSDYLS